MADKEERIYVYWFTDDDGICPLEEICTKFPRQCGNCKEIPTRAEVIERIEKKIDEEYIDENGCNKGLTVKELAEAALNALLGKE